MAITTETKTVYTCSDGKTFADEDQARTHEAKLGELIYYEIAYGADTCEGRGCLDKKAYVAVNAKAHHDRFVKHAMYKKFGSPVTFVQGVFGSNAIMDYWAILGKVSIPDYKKVIIRIEDRFATNNIFGEGIWFLTDGKWKKANA